MNYQYVNGVDGGINQTVIKRLPDGAIIPFDPDNTDYQAYLTWVALGNTPQPADEVTQ